MDQAVPFGRYDQGVFNTACQLAKEMAARNYLHFLAEVDASGMDLAREAAKRAGRAHPTYTAFVIWAAATALREHPHLNCMIQERPFSARLIRLPDVVATVAVERRIEGVEMVFAPTLRTPEECSPDMISEALHHFATEPIGELPEYRPFLVLVKLARSLPSLAGLLFRLPSWSPGLWRKYRGGSFAVTSPGKYGGCDQILPPWPWPLTFSFGEVKERPWASSGQVVVRKTMRLTITADRRLAHGAPLARFSARMCELLEHPKTLAAWAVQILPPLSTPGAPLESPGWRPAPDRLVTEVSA